MSTIWHFIASFALPAPLGLLLLLNLPIPKYVVVVGLLCCSSPRLREGTLVSYSCPCVVKNKVIRHHA